MACKKLLEEAPRRGYLYLGSSFPKPPEHPAFTQSLGPRRPGPCFSFPHVRFRGNGKPSRVSLPRLPQTGLRFTPLLPTRGGDAHHLSPKPMVPTWVFCLLLDLLNLCSIRQPERFLWSWPGHVSFLLETFRRCRLIRRIQSGVLP